MTFQINLPQPPRIFAWLIKLFASNEEEPLLGDLVEEYRNLASKSELAFARAWYRRQAAKTVVHLAGKGFRDAPLSIAAIIAGGFLLHGFVSGLPDKILMAVTERYLAFWSTHFNAYVWLLRAMPMEHLVLSMLVGCVVGFAAKGREMIATLTLALVFCTMIATALVWIATHRTVDLAWLLWSCADPVAVVAGGAIVRTRRSIETTLRSDA
jgi:ABC-type sugar transport system permease subunit